MMEKYIDLFPEIARMIMPQDERVGISTALRWLDEHPDARPEPTVTESQYLAETRYMNIGDKAIFDSALNMAGVAVAHNPKPTNAEKLDALYGQWLESDAPACRVSFHQFMDEAGVKAPGGDDE